jgi:hypothetical protein
MMPSLEECYAAYYVFNKKYFNGLLKRIEIEICESLSSGASGSYIPAFQKIKLSKTLLDQNFQEFKDTLCHEMIHVAQHQQGARGRANGPFFSALMHKINEKADGDVCITVYHHISEMAEFQENSILGKIKKLLSLSKSPNKNEACSAASKAQSLMAQHEVKETDLDYVAEGSELDDPLLTVIVDPMKRVVPWRCILMAGISKVNHCLALQDSGIGLRLVGNRTHMEICRSYFQYFVSVIEAESAFQASQGRVFVSRFREAMASEIGDRLMAQYLDQSGPASSVLTLASQYDRELKIFTKAVFPVIGSGRGSSRVGNAEATSAGRQAGAKVSTAKHIVQGARQLGAAQ